MINLVQQYFGTIPCFTNFPFGAIPLSLELCFLDCLVDGGAEQLEEFVADRLEHVIGRAGLEGCDRDRGIVGAGDVDHRRRGSRCGSDRRKSRPVPVGRKWSSAITSMPPRVSLSNPASLDETLSTS